jgi:hypothetical protein
MLRIIKEHWLKYLILLAGLLFAWLLYYYLNGWELLFFAVVLSVCAVYIIKKDVVKYLEEYMAKKHENSDNGQ